MRLATRVYGVRLRRGFTAAWGRVAQRTLLVVRLEDEDGSVGYGEVTPLGPYDGVEVAEVAADVEACRPALARARASHRPDVLAECAERTVLPHALAALDVALWDLEGRRARAPVWRLLGASAGGPVAVNYTIASADRAGAAREAAAARAAGFSCVKVKVGTGDDAGRVAAVRAAAGERMAVRLDANGAWSVAEARAVLSVLAPAGVELCEEPVHGSDAVAALTADPTLGVDVALDETTAEPGALDRRCCRAVCLKLGRCGGITGLVKAARRARRVGFDVYVASALEGPIGIAAALHAAAAIRPDWPCGLATLDLFERPAPAGLRTRAGTLTVPPGAGLGDGLVDWYR